MVLIYRLGDEQRALEPLDSTTGCCDLFDFLPGIHLKEHMSAGELLRRASVSRFPILIVATGFTLSTLLPVSCSYLHEDALHEKGSSLLLTQINLRKEQIADPTPDRLELMKGMGMRTDDLEIQQIFIHLAKEPTQSQIEELEVMGIILYLDSWIPPVGAHPTDFIIADMPIDKLEKVANK